MKALNVIVLLCTLSSLRAISLQPNQIVVDNELLTEILKRMEEKDEAINELRQTVAILRKDVDEIKTEKEQLKESFFKCEVAIQSMISESKNKTSYAKISVSELENDNANSFAEQIHNNSNMSSVRDTPSKKWTTINHHNKRHAHGPTISERDSKTPSVGKRHAGTDLVAFFATVSQHAVNLGVGQNLLFDHVITNIGSAYYPHLGGFMAPVSGVYVFMSTLFVYPGRNEYMQLVHNGNVVCNMVAITSGGQWDTTAGSYVLYLNKGDVIAIRNVQAGDAVYGENHSYFSGFLLKELEQGPGIVG